MVDLNKLCTILTKELSKTYGIHKLTAFKSRYSVLIKIKSDDNNTHCLLLTNIKDDLP